MSSDLETRLERAFDAIPPASGESTDRARRAALDALGDAPRHRRFALPLVAAAALVAVLVTTGVTLAATGQVTIPLVQKAAPPPPVTVAETPKPSPLPAGSAALAITIDGHRWSATRHGVRSHPGRLSALALSPGALYRLEAQGHRLRAVGQATGRVAFTHRLKGTAVSAAWSPLPIRIAYLELLDGGYRLHDMWGTGSHDRVTALPARDVAPSWRWDSLAVAFVRANGRVAILDATSGAVQTLDPPCGIGHADAVAFSPSTGSLAIADRHRLAIVDPAGGTPTRCVAHAPGAPLVAWIGGRRVALASGNRLLVASLGWSGLSRAAATVPAPITALAASPHGHRLLAALAGPDGTSVVPLTAAGTTGRPYLTLPHRHGTTSLQWR